MWVPSPLLCGILIHKCLHSCPSCLYSPLLASFSKSVHSAMSFPTAGTTFKQLGGHPSFRSPNHQLLKLSLSLPTPSRKWNPVPPYPSPAGCTSAPAKCTVFTQAQPQVGCTPGVPSNQGRKIAPGSAQWSHRTLTLCGTKHLQETNLATSY